MGGEAQDRTRVFGHSAGQNKGFGLGAGQVGFPALSVGLGL